MIPAAPRYPVSLEIHPARFLPLWGQGSIAIPSPFEIVVGAGEAGALPLAPQFTPIDSSQNLNFGFAPLASVPCENLKPRQALEQIDSYCQGYLGPLFMEWQKSRQEAQAERRTEFEPAKPHEVDAPLYQMAEAPFRAIGTVMRSEEALEEVVLRDDLEALEGYYETPVKLVPRSDPKDEVHSDDTWLLQDFTVREIIVADNSGVPHLPDALDMTTLVATHVDLTDAIVDPESPLQKVNQVVLSIDHLQQVATAQVRRNNASIEVFVSAPMDQMDSKHKIQTQKYQFHFDLLGLQSFIVRSLKENLDYYRYNIPEYLFLSAYHYLCAQIVSGDLKRPPDSFLCFAAQFFYQAMFGEAMERLEEHFDCSQKSMFIYLSGLDSEKDLPPQAIRNAQVSAIFVDKPKELQDPDALDKQKWIEVTEYENHKYVVTIHRPLNYLDDLMPLQDELLRLAEELEL